MKLVKGCLGMVVLLVAIVVVCGIIGINMKHSSSPSSSVPDVPTPDVSVTPTPSLPPPAVVYNTPAPKSVVVVPTTPPAPDLNAQLRAAQSNVTAAQLDLTKAKDAALARLKQSADYQSASADLAAADAQVKTDRANSDPNLPTSSQTYLNAKSKVLKMERDAVASDAGIAAAQQKISRLTGVVNGINSQITQKQAAEAAARQAVVDRQLALQKAERAKHVLSLTSNDASSLYAYYEKNEVKADEDCKGKWCLVTGKVDKIGKDILDTPYVAFASSNGSIFCVQAMFSDDAEIQKIKDLSPGQAVSIAGRCEGKMGNVILRDCKLVQTSLTTGSVDVYLK
jgi:hypothetical protein